MSQGLSWDMSRRGAPLPGDLRRARRELDAHGVGVAVSYVGELDRVAGLVRVDRLLDTLGRRHLLAVDGRDDVAAGRIPLAVDRLLAGGGSQVGVLGRRVRPDLGDLDARDRVELVGNRARDLLDGHAEVRVLDLAARNQLVRDLLDRVGRDRKADPDVGPRVAGDLRVDADHLAARIEQRAAGIAVVDRGIRLDRVIDREVVRSLHLPVNGADEAAGERLLEAKRAPDRDHRIAHLDVARIAERQWVQDRRRRVDLDHREVGRRVAADDRGLVGAAVPAPDRNRVRVVDHVLVRDDVPVGVDHEAGALSLGLLVTHRRLLRRRYGDLDHALVALAVDLPGREPVVVGCGLAVLDGYLSHDRVRRGRVRDRIRDCAGTRAEGEGAEKDHGDHRYAGAWLHLVPFEICLPPSQHLNTPTCLKAG